jgi:hypothetical protein
VINRSATPAFAKRTIARANCRFGKIRRAYSKVLRPHHLAKTTFGAVLQGGGGVNGVVSRGGKQS